MANPNQPEIRAEDGPQGAGTGQQLSARPKRYPPPEFPPRRLALFAQTPPAIFSPILGLLGLTMAAGFALERLELPVGLADLLAGAAVALWVFASLAYAVKVTRRPAVVMEDLRVLPGRSGLAAMGMGGMAAATLVAAYSPKLAQILLVLSLFTHAGLAVLLIRLLLGLAAPARAINPTWHLSFVGFIVAAPAAVAVGWGDLAVVLFWATLPPAIVFWAMSAVQFAGATPPAALRPLLAIHVSPAALLSTVAALLGYDGLATLLVAVGAVLALALILSLRWILSAGPSALWGAFTFPLAALSTAMLANGVGWLAPGLGLVVVGLVVIPAILWWVLRRWPGGKLAAATNAAEA